MKSRIPLPARGLALALAAFVQVSSSHAITITPAQPGATVLYDFSDPYTIGGLTGAVWLNPASVTLLPRGGTAGLLNLLKPFETPVAQGGGGWTFTTAAADLKGSFNITTYDAFASAAVNPTSVGANFAMDFVAGAGDPNGVTFHWIQRVYNNHSVLGAHGTPDDAIDATRTSPLTDPGRLFYDFDVNFATPPHFEDSPRRPDPANYHSWNAELYLVSIPNVGSKNVTIYNGVSWGWANGIPDTGGTFLLMAIGLAALAVLRVRRWTRRNEN